MNKDTSKIFSSYLHNALNAYEAAACVQFGNVDALATRDIDLLLDTRMPQLL